MSVIEDLTWVEVCGYLDVPIERAVAALVGDTQIALVRDYDSRVHALSNWDPFSGAYVMSRGIVGSHGDRQTLTSPMYKQSFDLLTGECLEDPSVSLPVYPVRVVAGRVMVGLCP